MNPAFLGPLEAAGLRVTGEGECGEVRVVELLTLRFFLATLFLPQLSSSLICREPDALVGYFWTGGRVAYLHAAKITAA